jgi:phage shock protein PspC (stress-responsive transcriptional regulator)
MNDSAPLHRAISGRMVGGVAAGLATYLGVDVTIVRIGFVVATVLGGGIGIAAYLAGQSMASSLIDSARGGR